MKSSTKFKHFHSRKCIWKCLRNGGNFVSVSMCWIESWQRQASVKHRKKVVLSKLFTEELCFRLDLIFNSLRSGDSCIFHWTGLALVQVMWCLQNCLRIVRNLTHFYLKMWKILTFLFLPDVSHILQTLVIACSLLGVQRLPKPMLNYHQLDPHKQVTTRQIRTPVLRIPPAATSQAKMKNWLHECQKWVSHMIGQYAYI